MSPLSRFGAGFFQNPPAENKLKKETQKETHTHTQSQLMQCDGGVILDVAKHLNNNDSKRRELVRCVGGFLSVVSNIGFDCLLDTHTHTKKATNTPFHVILSQDGVPAHDQTLLDDEEQIRRCCVIQESLNDFKEALGVVASLLDGRLGDHDVVNMKQTWCSCVQEDLPYFGFFNRRRITEFFDRPVEGANHHRTPLSRVYAGGVCYDVEKIVKSMAADFVKYLNISISNIYDLKSPNLCFASYNADIHLHESLASLIASHVSMSDRARSPQSPTQQSLDAEILLGWCDDQISCEAVLQARRKRDNNAVRLELLCDLVRFSCALNFELLRVLVEVHKSKLVEVLKNPPRLFKSHATLMKNFKWDALRQILEVHSFDDLLTIHIFRWAHANFDSPATSDALIDALERVIAALKAQKAPTSGFMPTLARMVGCPRAMPIPTWCQVDSTRQQVALATRLRDLKNNGMLMGSGASAKQGASGVTGSVIEMPVDAEQRMRLVSCILELATNTLTSTMFFEAGVCLVDHMRRVVAMQRQTVDFASGFVKTIVDSSQLGKNYLLACRRVQNFRGTSIESKIRKAGLWLSQFSSVEIYALASYYTQALQREMFLHARDNMVFKCHEDFLSLVPRSLKIFLPAFLQIRAVGGISTLRPSSVLEDVLRSIPKLMEWVESGHARGSEIYLTSPEIKEGVEGGVELLTRVAGDRSGLVAKRRIGSKNMFVINGMDCLRQLCGDVEAVRGLGWARHVGGLAETPVHMCNRRE